MPAKKKSKSHHKSHWVLTLIIGLIVVIAACFFNLVFLSRNNFSQDQYIQPKKQLDLPGTYQGDLPCADCPGIKETLTLNATDSAQTSGSYSLKDLYIDRDPNPIETQGTWEVIGQSILKLNPDTKNSQPQFFQITSFGNLEMLDSNMQSINSPFNQTLTKQKNGK